MAQHAANFDQYFDVIITVTFSHAASRWGGATLRQEVATLPDKSWTTFHNGDHNFAAL